MTAEPVPIRSNITETGIDIDEMASAYMGALRQSLALNGREFSNQARAIARCECALFLYRLHPITAGMDPAKLGVSFALIRNDRDADRAARRKWEQHRGDEPGPIDAYCEQIGPCPVTVGTDDLLHFGD